MSELGKKIGLTIKKIKEVKQKRDKLYAELAEMKKLKDSEVWLAKIEVQIRKSERDIMDLIEILEHYHEIYHEKKGDVQ